MKFALQYEIEMLKPWYPEQEYDTYWQATQQVVLADELGWDTVWCVEHHFLEEYSHSPAPEVWYGTLAGLTRNIRLGHGVVLLPYPFNHPVRVAERIAVLDIMSNGRVNFGTGRSITHQELGGFGVDPALSRPMWDEALSIIPKMWQTDSFSHEGKFFNIPPRNVIPKPIQKPHPPIFMATTQPDSFQLAGEKGVGCLGFLMAVELPSLKRRIDAYRAAMAACENPVGAFKNEHVGVFLLALCAKTNQEARRIAEESVNWYLQQTFEIFAQWKPKEGDPIPAGYEWYANSMLRSDAKAAARMQFDYLWENDLILVGDPDRICELIQKYEGIGVDELLMFKQFGRVPHDAIMDSIKLMSKHVLPYWKPELAGRAR
jgi:alkanesulfonate monooxygenase SsuD/methylene tetrahydromethanopterin reductase-like flavin-dependent oxidoreductase (luciferase family)